MRPIRNLLVEAGVPVENSKGEAEAGQEELNIRYADALLAPTITRSPSRRSRRSPGSRAARHRSCPSGTTTRRQSATCAPVAVEGGQNAFFDPKGDNGMSETMRQYMAGLLKYAPDYTFFLAPYVNSYKRFLPGTFAPTKTVWSVDNRTAGFRLCGDGTKAVRIECRIGGSGHQPLPGAAAQIAAGLKRIEDKVELAPPATGDVYGMDDGCRRFRARCARRPKPAQLENAARGDGRLGRRSLHALRRNGSRKRSTRRDGLGNRTRFRKGLTSMTNSVKHLARSTVRSICRAPVQPCTKPFAIAAKAREAQKVWAATPIAERIALVLRRQRAIGEQDRRS
jgi:hypothetical protein